MVGSGYIPFSSVDFLQRGWQVDALDISADAVAASKDLVNSLPERVLSQELKSRLSIQQMDGVNYDYRNADVIFLVSIIPLESKLQILDKIYNSPNADKKIVVFIEFDELGQLWAPSIPHEALTDRFYQERFRAFSDMHQACILRPLPKKQ